MSNNKWIAHVRKFIEDYNADEKNEQKLKFGPEAMKLAKPSYENQKASPVVQKKKKAVKKGSKKPLNCSSELVATVHSWDEFDNLKVSNALIMVSGAPWCPPCEKDEPNFLEGTCAFPKYLFKVEQDSQVPWSAHGLTIESVPTYVLKTGKKFEVLGNRWAQLHLLGKDCNDE